MTDKRAVYSRLIETAKTAAQTAYCPYSDFPVGAALLTVDGTVFTGCNVENASYTAFCAERTALVKAVSEGHRSFQAMAVYCPKSPGAYSCGNCRQFMCEFGTGIDVIVEKEGGVIEWMTLEDLLPGSFGPHSFPAK
jgi:cytidine deaminase